MRSIMHAMYEDAVKATRRELECLTPAEDDGEGGGGGLPWGARPLSAHISLDIWSSRALTSYLAVLLHTLNKNFDLKERCLLIVEFVAKHHTGTEISLLVKDALERNGLAMSVISTATSDSGSNVVKGLKDLGIANPRCTAHQLQRVIIRSIGKITEVKAALKRAKATVTLFTKSNVALAYMKEKMVEMNKPLKKLVQSNATRWSSFADSAESVIHAYPVRASVAVSWLHSYY